MKKENSFNPCEECIVTGMCQEVCHNLKNYVEGLFEYYDYNPIDAPIVEILCSDIRRTATGGTLVGSTHEVRLRQISRRICKFNVVIEGGKITVCKKDDGQTGSSAIYDLGETL